MSIVRDRKGSRPDAGKATTCDWGGGYDCKIHSIRCQSYCSWLMLDCGIGATEYVVIDELWDQVPLTVFCV